MKLLARTLLIIGGVVLVGAIVLLAYGGFEVWKQFIALSANRSLAFSNPVGVMLGGAALALLAGLFAGYALGMPRQPKQQPTVTPTQPQPQPQPPYSGPNHSGPTPPADPTSLR